MGETFEGVIDLITMQVIYFDGDKGETVRTEAVPAPLREEAQAARDQMLEALSMYSDTLMELLLSEEDVPEDLVYRVVREACQATIRVVQETTANRRAKRYYDRAFPIYQQLYRSLKDDFKSIAALEK